MRCAALVLAFGLTLAALPAAAQQKMVWHEQGTEYGSALIFGVPETDEAMIFFSCDKGKDAMEVRPLLSTKGLKGGDAARTILTAGAVKKIFTGKAALNEENGQITVIANGKIADLKALMKGGKAMSVEVKGAKANVSLQGIAQPAASFEAACTGG